MSSKDINNLVKKAKNGDADAFGELYAMYNREMFGFASYCIGDRRLAEDAVGDAVCEAFACIHSLRNTDKFKSWLFTILLRCCRRQISGIISRRNEADIDTVYDEPGEEIPFEERTELKQALSLIGEDEREILLLSCIGKYTSREIGEMLGMPPGTVRSKLKRTTDKLYLILTDERRNDRE